MKNTGDWIKKKKKNRKLQETGYLPLLCNVNPERSSFLKGGKKWNINHYHENIFHYILNY